MLFLICIIIYSSYNLVIIFMNYKAGNDIYENARQEFIIHDMEEEAPKENGIEASAGEANEIPLDKRIDFHKLKATNEDILGWINIKGTVVDYPLLMSRKSNDDYIYTTYEKKYSSFGSIFTDFRNEEDFTDRNTIIYGHNMKNGAMFGNLMKYAKLDYAKENNEVRVLKEEGVDIYKVYSAYKTLANSESYTYKFKDDNEFKNFIEMTKEKSVINLDVEVETQDRVITLSTCTDTGRTANRYVVHALYVETQEKE